LTRRAPCGGGHDFPCTILELFDCPKFRGRSLISATSTGRAGRPAFRVERLLPGLSKKETVRRSGSASAFDPAIVTRLADTCQLATIVET
jgi:hypothetical protein